MKSTNRYYEALLASVLPTYESLRDGSYIAPNDTAKAKHEIAKMRQAEQLYNNQHSWLDQIRAALEIRTIKTKRDTVKLEQTDGSTISIDLHNIQHGIFARADGRLVASCTKISDIWDTYLAAAKSLSLI